MRRFQTERWWERRVESYERVIEAFHHAKAFSEAHLNSEMEGTEIPEEKEILARAKKAGREIERAIDLAGFFLGNDAIKRLKQYQKDTAALKNVQDWFVFIEQDFMANKSCLEDLIQIAKRDLKKMH